MSLYELTNNHISEVLPTSFAVEQVSERSDLQRLLRHQVHILGEELLVIAEEFGEWEDSRRRIDLLALDKQANLVVIELKRTEEGGHMELQALRYAAMVSVMTFDRAAEVYSAFCQKHKPDTDARQDLLDFLDWTEPQEDQFAQDVRIILVAADFSKEITTTALWLNQRLLDIRCIRIKPYTYNGHCLINVQPLIPLPETADFQIKIRDKESQERQGRKKEKTLDQIDKEMQASLTPEQYATAQKIRSWLEKSGFQVFATQNGFAQYKEVSGVRHYFFKVQTNGLIQVWFYYLKMKEPFVDEGMRLELLERLNGIEGVELPKEKVGGKPSFSIDVLESEQKLYDFLAVFDSAEGKIQ